MKCFKRVMLCILLVMIIAVFVPVKVSAQTSVFSEMSGFMINTTAGTIEEGDWRLEGYSAISAGNLLSVSIGNLIDGFVGNIGASLMYGLSRNTEMCLNIQSFDNIFSGSGVNIPEIHLNCKVNLVPKYESTGLGFVIQLINFSGSSINTATDLYIVGTGVFQEAVLISVQAGLSSEDIRAAIATSPRESTNFLLELRYLSSSSSLVIYPGIKFGSSEKGFQVKVCTMIDVGGIDLDRMLIMAKMGINF